MTECKQWIYRQVPGNELVDEKHYELQTVTIDDSTMKENQIFCKSLYLSCDPYMRIQQAKSNTWEAPHALNTVQGGGAVLEVLKAGEKSGFKEGDVVYAYTGWRTHCIIDSTSARLLPKDDKISPSTALGVLGMPARTAYFGLLKLAEPKAGETVLVSGAAGAVGSIVAQLARIRGCRVVGIAGAEHKIKWLKEAARVDEVVNYKEHTSIASMQEALRRACPDGIDVYFDNTGARQQQGVITDSVWALLNVRGRVTICGQISQYNGALDEPELAPRFLHHVLYKRLRIEGVLARDWSDRQAEVVEALGAHIRSGELKYEETIVDGFEQLPSALNGLFFGKNLGKMIVRV